MTRPCVISLFSYSCHMINDIYVFLFFLDVEMYGRGVTLHVHVVPLFTVLHIVLN